MAVLGATALRDRYQQFAATARELLSDFREVEENFRCLDRAARERIAAWEGGKGELLAELVGSRSDIDGSDQGRSFQAFYDFLLSETRQDELADLLARRPVRSSRSRRTGGCAPSTTTGPKPPSAPSGPSGRSPSSYAASSTTRSGWRTAACSTSSAPWRRQRSPAATSPPGQSGSRWTSRASRSPCRSSGRSIDARPAAAVESLLDPDADDEADVTALFSQTFVDQARLADNIRAAVPERGSALLDDIVARLPHRAGRRRDRRLPRARQTKILRSTVDEQDETRHRLRRWRDHSSGAAAAR